MKVKPLTGQVLIEVLPAPDTSDGGVALPPDASLSPEVVQEQSRNPEKPSKNNIGIVREIGPWPKLRNGMARMPEYGLGARVLFNPWRGTAMQRNIGERFRMVRQEDVLAIFV